MVRGFVQVGGVPAVQDYHDFADISSFQQRVDLHKMVMQDVRAGTYYVAVYNNDAYFKVLALTLFVDGLSKHIAWNSETVRMEEAFRKLTACTTVAVKKLIVQVYTARA